MNKLGRGQRLNQDLASRVRKRLPEFSEKYKEMFSGLEEEHYLEWIRNVEGVDFINDSRSTNVNSTWYALENMEKPVILIMGGIDKGNDYSQIYDLIKKKVRCIIWIGKDRSKIPQLREIVPVVITFTMGEAIAGAFKKAKKGDVILLSPACISFDWFEDFRDRGRVFKNTIMKL